MGIEIERKFLVISDAWRAQAQAIPYTQGYITRTAGHNAVRVRIINNEQAVITIKGARKGFSRLEFEYPIPLADAQAMIAELTEGKTVEKRRTRIPYAGRVWEVDEFLGDNAGLILAEVELDHEDQSLIKPDWVGKEVTGDPRYGNAALERRTRML